MQSNNATLINYLGHKVYEECILGQKDVYSVFHDFYQSTQLSNLINYKFKNEKLLVQALSHTSFVHEYDASELKSYERLEFLGDSILGSYVALELYSKFNSQKEGNLSKIKNSLVNESSLFELSKPLNLSSYILLGKGELAQGLNQSIVSDVLEAFLGAICIDSSMQESFRVLKNIIELHEKETGTRFFDEAKISTFDSKSIFQELTMKEFKCLPEYEAQEVGNLFVVSVSVKGFKLHETQSHSKKQAMKDLAKYCLDNNLIEKIKESLC